MLLTNKNKYEHKSQNINLNIELQLIEVEPSYKAGHTLNQTRSVIVKDAFSRFCLFDFTD